MSPLDIPSLPWPVSPLSCEDASENLAPELKPKDKNYFITSAESKPLIAPNNCDDSQPLITPMIEQPIKINSTGFPELNNYESPQIGIPVMPRLGDVIELSINFLAENKLKEQ